MLLNNSLLLIWPLGLFTIAFFGLIFYFRDFIRLLIILELFLLANTVLLIVLLGVSASTGQLLGVLPLILSAGAADAAVGLGLLVLLFRQRRSIDPRGVTKLHG